MTDEMPPIRELHRVYQDMSGLIVTLSMSRVEAWRVWKTKGWTPEDLRMVMRMMARKIEEKPRLLRAYRFEYFVGNMERFEEDLAEAQALARTPKRCADHDQVMRTTARPTQQFFGDAKPVGDVMKANAALAELLKLRDQL